MKKSNLMNKIIITVMLSLLSLTLNADAKFTAQKARAAAIKFMNENNLAYKLTEPVAITEDDSGALRITDPGNYLVQYVILTPQNKSVTDPNVTRQLKIKIPKTCDKAVIVTHGWIDKGAGDWPADMAKAFREKVNPDEWVSLYFDWDSGSTIANPIDAVKYSRDVAGPRMAKALLSLFGPTQQLKHVHLIAHSAGAWAITSAAQIIADKTGTQIHLTLLDAYLPPKWDEKKLGTITADPPAYIEHYYTRDITFSVTETNFTAAHNVDLTAVDQMIKSHEYPYKWYAATITGKFRKKDYVVDKKIITKYRDIDYGFHRGLESSPENFKKSLTLKKANKGVLITKPQKKQKSIFDMSTWFK